MMEADLRQLLADVRTSCLQPTNVYEFPGQGQQDSDEAHSRTCLKGLSCHMVHWFTYLKWASFNYTSLQSLQVVIVDECPGERCFFAAAFQGMIRRGSKKTHAPLEKNAWGKRFVFRHSEAGLSCCSDRQLQ